MTIEDIRAELLARWLLPETGGARTMKYPDEWYRGLTEFGVLIADDTQLRIALHYMAAMQSKTVDEYLLWKLSQE